MRLPKTAHTSRPWRIHEIAPDFQVEDVWALPTPGGPDDLPRLIRQLSPGGDAAAPGRAGPTPVPGLLPRALFATRWKLGAWFGWDKPDAGLGTRVGSLRDRLPADLRDAPRGPDLRAVPFTFVFQTHDEWAAEMANKTVHTVMHIGWVPDGAGGHHGQMTVLVKPNGKFGTAYMAAIKPFRYLGVYPALLKSIAHRWQSTPA
ncbi:DUF2867 domain-containing protein [Dactylosporangium siamense]|uniref:DUF2867 domain-containing protein n=1 Tax=Dactylosporangium siamense TaxID=685454 RepID=A0A919PG16_9ACTN|nr:DUF2867 domain-containing protein [Dactylosporangium siamense]GIG44190.1 hypothetical protein Dsi01nite_022310 [Dactylosporangium siamense]